MSKNYAALAQDVLSALGGAGNIAAAAHGMTRLRFVLNDPSHADVTTLKP